MISFQSLKLLAASSLLAISVSLPSHAGVHVNVNVGIGTRLLWCSPDSRRDAFFVECKSHCGDRRGFGRCSDLPDGA